MIAYTSRRRQRIARQTAQAAQAARTTPIPVSQPDTPRADGLTRQNGMPRKHVAPLWTMAFTIAIISFLLGYRLVWSYINLHRLSLLLNGHDPYLAADPRLLCVAACAAMTVPPLLWLCLARPLRRSFKIGSQSVETIEGLALLCLLLAGICLPFAIFL
jgi:hypothetical protein